MSRSMFVNATLVDGAGGSPLKDAAVLVDDDRIVSVGPMAQVETPSDATVFDLLGKTLMPGLIEAHLHICGGTDPAPDALVANSVPFLALQGALNARALLDAGYTTARSLGAPGYADVALRQAITKGMIPGPRLLVSGEPLSADGLRTGSPGAFIGVDGARKAVRTQIRNGADVIKLVPSGAVGSNAYTMPWDTEMTREEMAAVADESHRLGKKVAAHAYSPESVTDCILAGIDSIEHGVMIDEPTIALMAEKGTALVPTMSAFDNYVRPGAEERFPAWRLERGRPMAEIQLTNFEKYLEYGIRIAAGSDGPRPGAPAGSQAYELQLMREAGMPAMQVLLAATKTAAEVLGLGDVLGTIEVGKLADLIVVDGDPLADVKVLQHRDLVKLVMKGGQVYRSSL